MNLWICLERICHAAANSYTAQKHLKKIESISLSAFDFKKQLQYQMQLQFWSIFSEEHHKELEYLIQIQNSISDVDSNNASSANKIQDLKNCHFSDCSSSIFCRNCETSVTDKHNLIWCSELCAQNRLQILMKNDWVCLCSFSALQHKILFRSTDYCRDR